VDEMVEQLFSTPGSTSVEPERELVGVGAQVSIAYCSSVRKVA